MKRKGLHFRPAHHLTFRDIRPEDEARFTGKGFNYFKHGDWVGGYAVILSIKRVEKQMKALFGKIPDRETSPDEYWDNRLEAKKVTPCQAFSGHSRTNMVYGKWRRNTGGCWFWVRTKPVLTPAEFKASEQTGDDNPEGWEREWFTEYWTQPVYWIEDGYVYFQSKLPANPLRD